MLKRSVNAPLLQAPITSDGHKRRSGVLDWCCWRTPKRACCSCCFVFLIVVIVAVVHSYMNDFWFVAPDVSLESVDTASWDVSMTPPKLAFLVNLTLGLHNPNAMGLTANWVQASVWKDVKGTSTSYHLADAITSTAVTIRPSGYTSVPIQARVDYKDSSSLNAALKAIMDDCGTDALHPGNTTLRINIWGEAHIVVDIPVPQIPITVTISCKSSS